MVLGGGRDRGLEPEGKGGGKCSGSGEKRVESGRNMEKLPGCIKRPLKCSLKGLLTHAVIVLASEKLINTMHYTSF